MHTRDTLSICIGILISLTFLGASKAEANDFRISISRCFPEIFPDSGVTNSTSAREVKEMKEELIQGFERRIRRHVYATPEVKETIMQVALKATASMDSEETIKWLEIFERWIDNNVDGRVSASRVLEESNIIDVEWLVSNTTATTPPRVEVEISIWWLLLIPAALMLL
jgi:hypothetical protein